MRPVAIVAGLALLGLGGFAASWAESPPATPAAPMARTGPSFPQGYLPRGAAPDSNLLVPPPPAAGSAAQARDVEAANAALALQGTPRFEQAAIDADLFSPETTGIFSCAAGMKIGTQTTPRTVALLRKAGPDLALAVYPTKRKYMRARPFMGSRVMSSPPSRMRPESAGTMPRIM